MGCEVYANSNEIACKAGDGKVIAAFPDVCLSPPSPPAGPIPLPYPNTSFSKDMMNGSKTVKIKGKEVMLKDQSFYKTAPLGDEAATQGLGAGVITHVITGKTYFTMWSMDVEFEGQNVDRHIDLTTSNHASPPANNGVPMVNIGAMATGQLEDQVGLCECCNQERNAATGHFTQADAPQDAAGQPMYRVMTFSEYYGVDDETPAGREKRRALAQYERDSTASHANDPRGQTCSGRVFPEPPCNVFRAVVSAAANARAHRRYRNWRRGASPEAAHMNSFIPAGAVNEDAQLNHLTPTSAGGCPTSPNNLQPNATLCQVCQDFDDLMGEWQEERADYWRTRPDAAAVAAG